MDLKYIGMFRITVLAISSLLTIALSHDEEESFDKFRSFFEVVEKLLDHDKELASLRVHLEDAKTIIADLNGTEHRRPKDTAPSIYAAGTYTRWGRLSCPDDATLVYEGYAAGSLYTAPGAAANNLCLPKNPDWDDHKETPAAVALIYGAEYETAKSIFHNLNQHDVPCAVCRVPRNNIIMVPGKNVCHQKYHLEYNGYLMSGYPHYQGASEYVCVDGEAERSANSNVQNQNGKLFYFVRASCGSLKCPPYKAGQDLTCAVCSFSP